MPLAFALALAARASPPARPAAGAVSLDELTAHFPACAATPVAAPRLDLGSSCVGEVCAGARFDALVARLGEAEKCTASGNGPWICRWPDEALTANVDRAIDLPAPAPDAFVRGLFLGPGHPARTADGLGIGVSFRCFAERFAADVGASHWKAEGGWLYLDNVQFSSQGFTVTLDREGVVQKMQLSPHDRPREERVIAEP